MAAAGIGAGDMIIGIQIGLDFNLIFVLAVIGTCILKYVLTEGIARYQLGTGRSLITAWAEDFPRLFHYLFFIFFVLWSIMVSAALMSACGIAGNALFPNFSIGTWGIIQSIITFIIIYFGRYALIEHITKWLVGLMFMMVISTAVYLLVMIQPDPLVLSIPIEYSRNTLLFAILGGVGGSVTVLSYGYWLREKGWNSRENLDVVRFDLTFSYFITGFFVLSVMYIASVLQVDGNTLTGSAMVLGVADMVGDIMGPLGAFIFKLGFWGVVFSSMITVWSGVPYIFSDFIHRQRKIVVEGDSAIHTTSLPYRIYLLFMTIIPMILTVWLDAVRNVINYTLISTVFVFGLAVTLLYLNSRYETLGDIRNGWLTNVLLVLTILSFAVMTINTLIS